jgi:hypothetical protein
MMRSIRNLACSAVLGAILAALTAAPALAAPSFEVTLERDSAAFPTVSHSDERVDYTVKVKNAGADPTSGTVTMELELPGGVGTFAYKTETNGWSCASAPHAGTQNAKVVCANSNVLSAGAEYPAVKVITALGADVPDVAMAKATAFGGGAGASSDDLAFVVGAPIPFEMKKFTAAIVDHESHDYTQAGGHGFAAISDVVFSRKRALVPEVVQSPVVPIEQVKQVVVDAPRGFVGNALALPELCPTVVPPPEIFACPPGSLVGGIKIYVSILSGPVTAPIYAIEPEFGVPAQFAFEDPLGNIYTFAPHLRADDGYAISFELASAPEVNFLESTVTLCNFGGFGIGGAFSGCKGQGEPGANPKPLFTNPTRCDVPLVTRARFNSWQNLTFREAPPFANAQITNCNAVHFDPQMTLKPTSRQADSPSGLEVSLSMPTNGLEGKDEEGTSDPNAVSQANLKQAKITFPEGMAINAGAGQGLNACSAEQVKLKTNLPIECPQSSKIGSVEIETPLIQDTLKGAVYVARQGDVEGALIGFYLVFDSPKNGILIKIPARVDADPRTGQLVTTVNESPEAPFSAVKMSFPSGPRATLLTPPKCGTYPIKAELTPWKGGAPVIQTSSFTVDKGPNGGPCPDGALVPKLNAGTESPVAGKTSPFVFRLSREDGTQRFTGVNLTTPPGLTAYLKDVPYCPQSAIDAAKAREKEGLGVLELNNPSCPAASQIGTASAGAGAGPEPLFVNTGKAYLAGPYKGAPLSLVLVAPAVAGPLDLGNVVVQTALKINPETAQVTAVSDPIPTILHGILLDVRDIRVALDRPSFMLNPTSCEPLSVGAEVKGESGATASLSNRFQVGGCENLAFKPKLDIRLFGGTRRGSHPSLHSVLEAAPGEANIGRAAVTIPRSEFLDQGHIRTICTRVQFAADACPQGSIYGHAVATSPIVGYQVEGPVYLRSSSHKLPDLVIDLHGPTSQPVEVEAVARFDSIKGQIRATFENAPDVPLTKLVVSMQGGKKGLLVNSRNICASTNRATVKLTGHNGAPFNSRPAVKNSKCGTQHRAKP